MDVTPPQPATTPSEADPFLVLLARIVVRMLTEQHDPSRETPHDLAKQIGRQARGLASDAPR
jgi:hypothetical protein